MTALTRAPAMALLLLLLSLTNACASGGGAKGLIEDLIDLSLKQAEILDTISDANDLKKAKGKILAQAKAAAKLGEKAKAYQQSGAFGEALEKNPKLAQKLKEAGMREQQAMQAFMARVDKETLDTYLEWMKSAKA
jgi:hypothetical protein